MKRYLGISLACFCSVMIVAGVALAKPTDEMHAWTPIQEYVDVVGNVEGTTPGWSIAAQGTIWIADWNFDDIGCPGYPVPEWERHDFRIQNDGQVFWDVSTDFSGIGNISGNAASNRHHDLCWVFPDGYDNDWFQAICIHYTGDSKLSFDWLVDSEAGFDFLRVETDSACASFELVNYENEPDGNAFAFRDVVQSAAGLDTTTARYDSLDLSGYGTADTHCVYIAFFADGGFSPADGLQPTTLGASAVIDNVLLEGTTGGLFDVSEDFESFVETPWFSFQNIQDGEPFGQWARTFSYITDNDLCTENITCAWLDTDHTSPTLANDPSQSFGPGMYVIKNWWDEVVIGPWVSLASTQGSAGTVLSFRRFPGNFFSTSRAVQNWSVRGRLKIANTDTPTGGDSLDCVTSWGHVFQWNSLGTYRWITSRFAMEADFDPNSRDIQVRFRNSDWRWIAGAGPPSPHTPGPGPYWDRVAIGRLDLTGPVIDEGIDARYQAQDCAPTDFETGPLPAPDYHMTTATPGDQYGTSAFSRSTDGGINDQTANLILGDSITIDVTDVRNAGGITSVNWYGCIVRGPHAGKAPSPYTIGANGFFCVAADTAYNSSAVAVAARWAIDLDDTYFRGGDELRYFWAATDAAGGFTSNPVGMDGVPASLDEAEFETGGIFEVSYLPTIDWDPAYLARIAADQHGDLDPTAQEIANSSQKNCILYYENLNSRRRSSDQNRTSFMYTLDRLGYRGCYDVYDHTGLGNTNNHLGSRMTVAQAREYSLLVYDAGNRTAGAPILPNAVDIDANKINMDAWFATWVAAGNNAGVPAHTLWIVSTNAAQERPGGLTMATASVALASANETIGGINPRSFGVQNHSASWIFVGNTWDLNGGCPTIRHYDALLPLGGATETHTYGLPDAPPSPPNTGHAAVVMNTSAEGNHTIFQTHPWFDIRQLQNTTPVSPQPEETFMTTVLGCVLPQDCIKSIDPTDVPDDVDDPTLDAVPAKYALRQNYPNPFNPTTTIAFDLPRDGHVSLEIYDVAGRLVRTLVKEKMTAGSQTRVWNGLDNSGDRVSSGVYFYRLVSGDFKATKKMVVMK